MSSEYSDQEEEFLEAYQWGSRADLHVGFIFRFFNMVRLRNKVR
jgi:hypothetical protein